MFINRFTEISLSYQLLKLEKKVLKMLLSFGTILNPFSLRAISFTIMKTVVYLLSHLHLPFYYNNISCNKLASFE